MYLCWKKMQLYYLDASQLHKQNYIEQLFLNNLLKLTTVVGGTQPRHTPLTGIHPKDFPKMSSVTEVIRKAQKYRNQSLQVSAV